MKPSNQASISQDIFEWSEPKCTWNGPIIDGKGNGNGVLSFTECGKDGFSMSFAINDLS